MKFAAILLAILALAFVPLRAAAADDAPKPRLNVLYIMSDDHAYQAISAYGFGLNKTPSIDKLAAEGMRFTRCLTTNSLCGPARATLLTGKYSHLNHFYNNTNSRFDGSQMTFPKLLQQAGYQTAIIGKWHLETDPTGFDYWEILPGQGQYYNPPMILNGQRIKKEGYITDIITDESLDWLKNKRDKNKPFVLLCHHKAPHREWEPALNHLSDYDGVKFPEPPTLFDDYSGRGKAEHEQDMMIKSTMNAKDLKLTPPPTMNAGQRKIWDAYYHPRNEEFKKQHLEGDDLVRWKYQRYLHDYFAVIASVDDGVGKLLDYLKESGLDQNTVVVYTSDQGFFLGEHGWFDKRWIFEESLKTPLLVRWPGVTKPGSVNDSIVSNLDYGETILDACGVQPPPEMQGRSMRPVLEGQTPPDWRKAFYYHYYEHPGPHNVPKQYGVITDQYKLVYFYEPDENYWELFDLKADPHELKSVYDDPNYASVRKELHARLDALRTQLKEPAQDPPDSMIPAKGQAAGGPAGRAKPLNAWVLEYRFDRDKPSQVIGASGKGNFGKPSAVKLVEGRNGANAREFDGNAYIEVPRSQSLNPAVGQWTIEVTFKADKPEGVVLAQGGESNGYCLYLESGKPRFAVAGGKELTVVAVDQPVVGKWVTVHARDDENNASLDIDGQSPAREHLKQPIQRQPNEALQIGADLGSSVTGEDRPKFAGLIESVRIFSGQAP